MAFEGIRFVHAGNLFVDHQLQVTGTLPDPMRVTVEDATVTAFERVVAAHGRPGQSNAGREIGNFRHAPPLAGLCGCVQRGDLADAAAAQ